MYNYIYIDCVCVYVCACEGGGASELCNVCVALVIMLAPSFTSNMPTLQCVCCLTSVPICDLALSEMSVLVDNLVC